MGLWPFGKGRKNATRFDREAMPHIDAVYRFARSLTHDAAEADDLVQETYLKALKGFDGFREGTNCRAWLFRICRNSFINKVRAGGREVALDHAAEQVHASSLSGWSERAFYRGPEAAAMLSATRDELESALEELPRDFRNVVVLADVEGLAYKEIAEVMGTPIGTVMSRLYRGRRMMREKLVGDAGNADVAGGGAVLSLAEHRKDRENGNGL